MKIDVSILSFVLVLLIAIPVTALRSGTYSIGYEIADLKSQERELYETNLELKARLAVAEARVYEKHMGRPQSSAQSAASPLPERSERSDTRHINYTPFEAVTEAASEP